METIRVRLLGGIEFEHGEDRQTLHTPPQQKALALLAFLLVARPRGYHQRDRLLPVFWPDADDRHARHALSQTLHELRKALGERAVLTRRDAVAINRDVVWCDTVALEAVIARDDAMAVLELYHGDLLAAFHIRGCREFEEWRSAEARRFRDAVITTLLPAIIRHRDNGGLATAVHLARRAHEIARLDERTAAALADVLAWSGDRAGALTVLHEAASSLRTELGVGRSVLLDGLAASIKAADRVPAATGFQAGTTLPDKGSDRGKQRRWTRRGRLALTVAIVSGCVWLLEPSHTGFTSTPGGRAVAGPITVAVLPFAVRAPAGHEFLREGMVDLLSAKLNSALGLRSVDPQVLLAVPALQTGHAGGPSLGNDVAEHFGASYYVLGSVVAVGELLHIAATLRSAGPNHSPVATTAVAGPSNEMAILVDRVAADLFSAIGSPPERVAMVASITTQSTPALRAYLDGERAFRRANWAPTLRFTEPIGALRAAVALDSTFALAYYRLAVAAAWADSLDLARWGATRAARYAARLPAHYRLLIDGLDAYLDGDAQRALVVYQAAVGTHPDGVEAWSQLATAAMFYAPLLGLSSEHLKHAATMATRYNTQARHSWIVLSYAAAEARDFGSADTLIHRAYPDGVPPFWQTLIALGRRDTRAARRALARLELAEAWEQTLTALLVTRYLSDASLGRRLGWRAVRSAAGSGWHAEALQWISLIELAGGRPRGAATALNELEAVDPARAREYRAMLAAWPLHPSPHQELQAVRLELRRHMAAPHSSYLLAGKPSRQVTSAIRLYLLGLVTARLGARDSAFTYADGLSRMPLLPSHGSVGQDLARFLEAEVRATMHNVPGRAGPLLSHARYRLPIGLLRAHPALHLVFARQRFLQADWCRAVALTDEALRWYASLGHIDHLADLPFLGPASLRTAEILVEQGRPDQARQHYTRFLSLWRDAEPELRSLVDSAHQGLDKLDS